MRGHTSCLTVLARLAQGIVLGMVVAILIIIHF